MLIMSEFKKVEFKIRTNLLQRLENLAEILNISFERILNICLLHGILPFWIPYQQLLTELSDKETPINEEDYREDLNRLSSQINLDFQALQELEILEEEFEELYPFHSFEDNNERRKNFISFIRGRRLSEKEEKEKEILKNPDQEHIIHAKPQKEERKEKVEEEETFPSLVSRFLTFLKVQVISHTCSYKDGITHGKFLLLLGLLNFWIFYSLQLTWPYLFDFGAMLLIFPLWQALVTLISMIFLIPVVIIITGFLIGKIYYFFIQKKRFVFALTHIIFPLKFQRSLDRKVNRVIYSKVQKISF